MRRPGGLDFHHVLVAILIFVLEAALLLAGCGRDAGTTTTSAAPTTGTTQAAAPGTTQTAATSILTTGTTTIGPSTTGGSGPGSTVVTVPATRALTFVGPLSQATLRRIRDIVSAAGGGGQKVLDGVAALAAGAPVPVSDGEMDAARGAGYAVGATSSQPVAAADVPDGGQVFLMAFTVGGKPDQTTIVAFAMGSGRFVTREGPLPIVVDTLNITTTTG